MIICKKCGHQNPDGTEFCESCRAFLEWSGERAPEPTKAGVKVLIVPTSMAVEAGSVGAYELSIQNTGSVVDSFVLQIPDVTWMTVDPPEVNLFPGKTTKARIDARPPRNSSVRAGQLRFTARATSRADPQISAEEMAVVAVGPYAEVSGRLLPPTSRGTQIGTHTVAIENRGNQPVQGSVQASDPEAALAFDIAPQTFTAAPGESVSVRLGVRPGDGTTVTQERARRFQVRVEPVGAPPIVLDGTMIQTPEVVVRKPRRPWLLWALAAAVILVLGGGIAYAALGGLGAGGISTASPSPSSRLTKVSTPSPPKVSTPSPPQVVVADISVSPTALDWSPLPEAPGTIKSVHVNNAGVSAVTINELQLQGDPAFQFDIRTTCSLGTSLAPNQGCDIFVAFVPQEKGAHTGSLLVAVTGASVKSVALTFFPVGSAGQGVPNVYGMDYNAALTALGNAGYVARVIYVCSGSVGGGKVRQVLTDIGSADGTIVDDASGVTNAGQGLQPGANLVLKVSTGSPC